MKLDKNKDYTWNELDGLTASQLKELKQLKTDKYAEVLQEKDVLVNNILGLQEMTKRVRV